jgi:IS5 family transposase
VNYYGYKNHVKVDAKSKLIVKYEVTDASVHDSQVLEKLLDEKDAGEDFNADSAYSGEKQRAIISQKEMTDKTCKKGFQRNSYYHSSNKNGNKNNSISRQKGTSTKIFR